MMHRPMMLTIEIDGHTVQRWAIAASYIDALDFMKQQYPGCYVVDITG